MSLRFVLRQPSLHRVHRGTDPDRATARRTVVGCALFVAILWAGCGPDDPYRPLPMEWSADSTYENDLPRSIEVFTGRNRDLPLQAYLVEVDLADSSLRVDAVVGTEPDGRAKPTEFARSNRACVLINGGYYWIDRNDRGRNIGLLVAGGLKLESPIGSLVWQNVRYPVARATIGGVPGRLPEIAWTGSLDSTIVRWGKPFDNSLGRPALPRDPTLAEPWPVSWALSAGPALVVDGQTYVYREEEGFFDTYNPRIHPRSAIGITADGRLLLLVVDGRQPHSRGVYLEELGVIMHDLGAVHAMNLDGGGSSALVVAGQLLNRPSGTDVEREVASAITIHCPDHEP